MNATPRYLIRKGIKWTLASPLIAVWCVLYAWGWLLYCLDDDVTIRFWPPASSTYLQLRCCGVSLSMYKWKDLGHCDACKPRSERARQ